MPSVDSKLETLVTTPLSLTVILVGFSKALKPPPIVLNADC